MAVRTELASATQRFGFGTIERFFAVGAIYADLPKVETLNNFLKTTAGFVNPGDLFGCKDL
jgi:hypothetical protein